MGPFRRLRALEAQVQSQEKELLALREQLDKATELLDLADLERMRGSVLNALRALRRSQQAQDARTDNGEGSSQGDDIDRLLALRRGHGVLPSR